MSLFHFYFNLGNVLSGSGSGDVVDGTSTNDNRGSAQRPFRGRGTGSSNGELRDSSTATKKRGRGRGRGISKKLFKWLNEIFCIIGLVYICYNISFESGNVLLEVC